MMPALALTAVLAAGSIATPAASTAHTHADARAVSLVDTLRDAGFQGQGLRIAWAIVMRESRGRANIVSRTGDYGLFQINKTTYGRSRWWLSDAHMLDARYNAAVAFVLSGGGRTFYPWDIDGRGRHLARYSDRATYLAFRTWLAKAPVIVAEAVIACDACGMPTALDADECPTCRVFGGR